MLIEIGSETVIDEDTGTRGLIWFVNVNGRRWYGGDEKPDRTLLARIEANARREFLLTGGRIRNNQG